MSKDQIVITPKTVDNPANGNCAFHAFAIGLINIIKYENQTGVRSMFDKWVSLDPSIEEHYIRLLKFDFDKPDNRLLDILQRSLRQITFNYQVQELQQACVQASVQNSLSPLFANSYYNKFAALYYYKGVPSNSSDYQEIDPNHNPLASIREITTRINGLQFTESTSVADTDNALANLFLEFLYGSNVQLANISAETPLLANSCIIRGMQKITKDRVWGTALDLDYLAQAFEVNLHPLFNGESIQEFNDLPDRHTITLNNGWNIHWTSKIPMAFEITDPSNPKRYARSHKTKANRVVEGSPVVNKKLIHRCRTPKVAKEITVRNAERMEELQPVRNAIELLKAKKEYFYKKGERSPRYATASYACRRIKNALETLCTNYESKTIKDLSEFKSNVKQLLDPESNDIKNLKTHRGFKEIFYNLLVAVATLGMAHFVYSAAKGRFTLFHIPTKSEQLLDNVNSVVDGLLPKP